jgi:ABC-type sugar transport system substrate-binding protein
VRKRVLGLSIAAGCLLVCVGAAIAAVQAKPPAGEPVVPGVAYAPAGAGAPYLPTKGAPRHMSGRGIGQLGGKLQAAAIKAGTAAGKAAGPKAKKPLGLRVGFLDIIGGIESADRVDNSWRNAFQHLGAKWIYCDGQGTPSKWATCGSTLIAQGANVLAMNGIDPSTVPSVLAAAKKKGIPVISCCGGAGPGFDVSFAPKETYAGNLLAKYLQAKMKSRSGTQEVLALDYPAPWAQDRTKALKAMVAKDSHFKVVATAVTDPTNITEGTRKQVSDELTANPGIKAIWASFDTPGQVVGQLVSSKFPGKKFPDKPLVLTFHADPSTQPLLKSGAIDVVMDYNYDVNAWESVDALVQHLAHKKPFPPYSSGKSYPGIGDPMTYALVTGKNLPPANTYPRPRSDAVSYFIAKWKAEGVGK